MNSDTVPSRQWSHDRDSVTNDGTWGWNRDQIWGYIVRACTQPDTTRIQSKERVADLNKVYRDILYPAFYLNHNPWVGRDGCIMSISVGNEHGVNIPVCNFYDALAWVMTVTEFATKEDRQRLGEGDSESVVKILSHVVQWAGALTLTRKEKHDKESTHGLYRAHLPETACIVRSKPVIETGLEDPGYLFAIGFSLPNTYARSGSISTPQGAKGQATAIRMRHLELMFGDMSGKTARQKIRCDAQANRGKYGHCAETNALSSVTPKGWGKKALLSSLAMNITQFIGVPISSWNEFARQLWYEGDTVAKLFKAMCHNCQELFILTSVKNWGPVPEIMGHWGDLQREVLHARKENAHKKKSLKDAEKVNRYTSIGREILKAQRRERKRK